MGVMRESAGWTAPLLSAMGSPPLLAKSLGQTLRWMDTPQLRGKRKGEKEMDALLEGGGVRVCL